MPRRSAIERAKIIELRKTGRPVFITGDFNDREKAFCPTDGGQADDLAEQRPQHDLRLPEAAVSIDWIFAAGQVRFSFFSRDTYPQTANISDHPVVRAPSTPAELITTAQ